MKGVRRIVAAKLQNLPRKLNRVLTMSFLEKEPRKVTGTLSVMPFNGELRDSLTLLLKDGAVGPSILRRSNVFTISQKEMVPNGPVVMLIQGAVNFSCPATLFPADQTFEQGTEGGPQNTITRLSLIHISEPTRL